MGDIEERQSDFYMMNEYSAHIYCCGWCLIQKWINDKDDYDREMSRKAFDICDNAGLIFW